MSSYTAYPTVPDPAQRVSQETGITPSCIVPGMTGDFIRDAFQPASNYGYVDPAGGVQTHVLEGFWPRLMGGELQLE